MWRPAADKEAFRPFRCIKDSVYLSTNEIEDLVSHIASRLRLLFPLTGVMRITYSRPTCVIVVANAVVASVAPVIASFIFYFCNPLANSQDTGN